MSKSIYELGLHEGMEVDVPVHTADGECRNSEADRTGIMRVPGGWLYGRGGFVPYSEEFKEGVGDE